VESRVGVEPAQGTVGRPVTVTGIGLHTGAPVRLRLEAAPAGSGIVFRRLDRADAAPIRAIVAAVRETRRGITLGAGDGATVATVEHLLSAAAGMAIDNLRVDVEGPELPALDGSAAGFVRALEEAGRVTQEAPAREIRLGACEVGEGQSRAVTSSGEELRLTYTVDLPAPLGRMVSSAGLDGYRESIAPARTWGFADEAAALEAAGLARGASLDNVLVIGAEGYVNAPRFPDEPARHKILDLIGDLALLGARLRGRVEVIAGGHSLHLALAREIARRWGAGEEGEVR
jgi:UDP-3-O-[3-hydroxymyristoyl] N-acetylglucosamine deacetylase